MQQVFPDYYKDFRCIGGACGHNCCCVGWEIDVDPETEAYYRAVPGELGKRLRAGLSTEGETHILPEENGRCPFLNGENLCDIILNLGEDRLCSICTDHPRFRNELPGRVETGIGLCCEEAGRLILGRESPMKLEPVGEPEGADEIIDLRDEVLAVLQDRRYSIGDRVDEMLRRCGAAPVEVDFDRWVEVLLSLERLEEGWTQVLNCLSGKWREADLSGFDSYMSHRQTEYEQLLVYFVYRHLANAFDEVSLAARASFAALAYTILRVVGAVIWTETGAFPFAQQVELARMFSSEVEYSEDNMDVIWEELIWG